MPYKKDYKRKYRKLKKKNASQWWNRKYSVAEIAGKALSGVNYIRGLVNSEKYSLENSSTTNPSSTGTITHITAVGQGDGEASRTGNGIFVRSFYMRMIAAINPSAATTFVRFMLIRDTQQIADTAPAIGDVLDSANTYSVLNDVNKGRFDILCDKVFQLSDQKKTFAYNCRRVMRSHVRYNGANTTDQQKNALYWILISDQATNTPTVAWSSRLQYHDN